MSDAFKLAVSTCSGSYALTLLVIYTLFSDMDFAIVAATFSAILAIFLSLFLEGATAWRNQS